VTFRVADALMGVEVAGIREVFLPQGVTPAPLAPPEVAGLLNLRGRIVTLVCLRRRLGLPPRPREARPAMTIGVDLGGDSYGLLVDSVEEVLKPSGSTLEDRPPNLDPRWTAVSRCVHRLPDGLLLVLDVEALLDLGRRDAA